MFPGASVTLGARANASRKLMTTFALFVQLLIRSVVVYSARKKWAKLGTWMKEPVRAAGAKQGGACHCGRGSLRGIVCQVEVERVGTWMVGAECGKHVFMPGQEEMQC